MDDKEIISIAKECMFQCRECELPFGDLEVWEATTDDIIEFARAIIDSTTQDI